MPSKSKYAIVGYDYEYVSFDDNLIKTKCFIHSTYTKKKEALSRYNSLLTNAYRNLKLSTFYNYLDKFDITNYCGIDTKAIDCLKKLNVFFNQELRLKFIKTPKEDTCSEDIFFYNVSNKLAETKFLDALSDEKILAFHRIVMFNFFELKKTDSLYGILDIQTGKLKGYKINRKIIDQLLEVSYTFCPEFYFNETEATYSIFKRINFNTRRKEIKNPFNSGYITFTGSIKELAFFPDKMIDFITTYENVTYDEITQKLCLVKPFEHYEVFLYFYTLLKLKPLRVVKIPCESIPKVNSLADTFYYDYSLDGEDKVALINSTLSKLNDN